MTKIVYQTDGDGVFIGAYAVDQGDRNPLQPDDQAPDAYLIPGGCVVVAPPVFDAGQRVRWVDGDWVIEDAGAPDAARRRAEVIAELRAIDLNSVRPLRAIAAGADTPDDVTRLTDLDAQAAALRAELAALS